MILNGECGQFNPLLLECLQDIQDRIDEEFQNVEKSERRRESGAKGTRSDHGDDGAGLRKRGQYCCSALA